MPAPGKRWMVSPTILTFDPVAASPLPLVSSTPSSTTLPTLCVVPSIVVGTVMLGSGDVGWIGGEVPGRGGGGGGARAPTAGTLAEPLFGGGGVLGDRRRAG